MYKKVLIAIFLFLAYNVFSQTGNPKKDTIDDIIDCYTYEILKISLDGRDLEDFKNKFDFSDKKIEISKIKELFKKDKERTALIGEIQNIKSEKEFLIKDKSTLISFLTEKIFSEKKYKAINEIIKKRREKFDKLNLKEIISVYLSKNTEKQNDKQDVNTNVVNIPTNNDISLPKREVEKSDNNLFFYIILLVTILNIILIIILYKKILDLRQEVDDNDKTARQILGNHNIPRNYEPNNKIPAYFNDSIKKINELEREISQIKNKLSRIHDEIKSIKLNETENQIETQTQIETPLIINNPSPIIEQPFQLNQKENISNKSIYYFSTPNNDGSFLDTNKSPTFESSNLSKYFKFEIDNNNMNTATVSIIEDPTTQIHILKNYKEYLDSVCIYSNLYSQKVTRITTKNPGIAILDGDKWIIKDNKKIEIQFE